MSCFVGNNFEPHVKLQVSENPISFGERESKIQEVLPILVERSKNSLTSMAFTVKNELRKQSDKLYFIVHNLLVNSFVDAPVLCSTANKTTNRVALSGADIREAKKYIQMLTEENFGIDHGLEPLDQDLIKMIKNFPVRGSFVNGICLGAVIFTIKELLEKDPITEKELIDCIKPFKNGFPKEAAGLQGVMKSFYCSYKKFISPLDFEDKWRLQFDQHTLEIELCASLAGIKVASSQPGCLKNVPLMTEDERSSFNQLNEGYYGIYFCEHIVVYVKKEFGSYLLDPNAGLIQCQNENPVEVLKALVDEYYSISANPRVWVFPFSKA